VAKQNLILNPTKLPNFQEVFKLEGFINPKTQFQNGTQGSVIIIIIIKKLYYIIYIYKKIKN
jgi:hypothetical protein